MTHSTSSKSSLLELSVNHLLVFAEECLVFLFSFSEPLQTAAHMFVAYEVSQVTYRSKEPISRSLHMYR